MAAFNNTAIGAGSTRQKYEKRLLVFLRKAFEVILAFFSFFSHSIIEVCSFFHAQIFFYPFFFFFWSAIFFYFVDGNCIVYELSVILCVTSEWCMITLKLA